MATTYDEWVDDIANKTYGRDVRTAIVTALRMAKNPMIPDEVAKQISEKTETIIKPAIDAAMPDATAQAREALIAGIKPIREVWIGNVSTSAPGGDAVVEAENIQDGNLWKTRLDFVLPRGEIGPAGAGGTFNTYERTVEPLLRAANFISGGAWQKKAWPQKTEAVIYDYDNGIREMALLLGDNGSNAVSEPRGNVNIAWENWDVSAYFTRVLTVIPMAGAGARWYTVNTAYSYKDADGNTAENDWKYPTSFQTMIFSGTSFNGKVRFPVLIRGLYDGNKIPASDAD